MVPGVKRADLPRQAIGGGDRRLLDDDCVALSWAGMLHLPVDKHAATAVQPVLDELVGRGKVLQQILIFDVVDFYHHVLEGGKKLLVQRQA